MTEDVKIRVTADVGQLVSELQQATSTLKGMAATAQRSSASTASSSPMAATIADIGNYVKRL